MVAPASLTAQITKKDDFPGAFLAIFTEYLHTECNRRLVAVIEKCPHMDMLWPHRRTLMFVYMAQNQTQTVVKEVCPEYMKS